LPVFAGLSCYRYASLQHDGLALPCFYGGLCTSVFGVASVGVGRRSFSHRLSALVHRTRICLIFLAIAVHLRALKVQGFLLSFLKGYFLYF
jgi:hypothetical protein